ncbi:MAG: hypothetical protein GXO57_07075 [Thermodesulfobacteria bacterium]|nr:hypothetical protein [Thermodesulfobacteriota bacterium]
MQSFKELLKSKDFVVCFEVSPGTDAKKFVQFIKTGVEHDLFDAVSITDNLGGTPALPPDLLAKELISYDIPAIIHFSCKDKNRTQIESELLRLWYQNTTDLLVMTGDHPSLNPQNPAKPVFDFDAVLTLLKISQINKNFFKGCVVNPFKLTITELWLQYFKLYKKIKAGADFVVTQSGFLPLALIQLKEVLKRGLTKCFSELLKDDSLFSTEEDQKIRSLPFLVSVIYPSKRISSMLIELKIPGILISPKVYQRLKNGETSPLEEIAKFCAIVKGLGFKGLHLCGMPHNLKRLEEFKLLLEKYEKNWQELVNEFDNSCIYKRNGDIVKVEMEKIFKNNKLAIPFHRTSLKFLVSHLFHELFFNKNSLFFPFLKFGSKVVIKSKLLTKFVTWLEYFIKRWAYGCRECGECRLYEFNYNCPFGGCTKGLINGPCGGSFLGFCEMYPFKKKCVFVKAVEDAPRRKDIKKLLIPGETPFIKPRNWAKKGFSSWLNFYLEK